MTRISIALLVTQLVAAAALAQSTAATSPAEFGRSFGGEIQAMTKHGSTFSGTLGLMRSNGGGGGYETSLGGSLGDRVWFFASALRLPSTTLGPRTGAVDATVRAQPVDWSNLSASYRQEGNATLAAPQLSPAFSSSFLSLRSTSMLSSNMVMDIHVSQQSVRPGNSGLWP